MVTPADKSTPTPRTFTDDEIASMLVIGEQYTRWFTKIECEKDWHGTTESVWPHVDPKHPDFPVELRIESRTEEDGYEVSSFRGDMQLTVDQAEQLAADLLTCAELSRRFKAATS